MRGLGMLRWICVSLLAVAQAGNPTSTPSLSPNAISIITTIAGTGTGSYSGDDGVATSATIYFPHGIDIDSKGNVFFSDNYNNRVRVIAATTGIITTYAGTGASSYSGDGGAATSAALWVPNGLYIDSSDDVFISDYGNCRVRKVVASTNIITTIAGTGYTMDSFSGDNGPATSADLNNPSGVAVDSSGNIYIADMYNHRVRKVAIDTTIITTIAGTGTAGYSGDGDQATSAMIKCPVGINLDSADNVYFGDYDAYNVVRKITVSTGVISTVAGTGSTSGGYNGDNIQATTATLNYPNDVVLDSNDNLYICDGSNYRIRKVDATGVITTVVGTGAGSSTGDGSAATSATIKETCYSRFDAAGNYYISECGGNRLRKVVTVSTGVPSTNPTSTPTAIPTAMPSAPTIIPSIVVTAAPSSRTPTMAPTLDPVDVVIFDTTSSGVAEAKIKFYLVSFVLYFASIYFLLYVFKRSNYGRRTVELLHLSSYNAQYYKQCSRNVTPTESERQITDFNNIFNCNKVLCSVLKEEEQIVNRISSCEDAAAVSSEKDDTTLAYTSCKTYICYTEQRRYLLGCAPILYPAGYKLDLYFFRLELSPGYVENLMLYLCNSHQFFNMMYYIDYTKRFGSRGRILVYVVRESVVLVLTQLLSTLAQYYSIDYYAYINIFVKIFIIIPISTIVGLLLLYMYAAPCVETDMSKVLKRVIILSSRFFIVPFIIIMSGALVVACLFTTGNQVPLTLLSFFLTVQLLSIVLQIIKACLGSYDKYFSRLSLMGVIIYSIGDVVIEKIVAENLVLGVDYFCHQRRYLGGVIRSTTIWSIQSHTQNYSADDKVEMKAVIDIAGCSNDRFDGAVLNPIYAPTDRAKNREESN